MAAMMSQNPPTMTSLKLPEESSDAPTDFHKLKEISEKLNLATRRPSVVRWKQIIENRKSNGLYTNDLKPPFLDQMAERIMEDGSCTEATAKVDASKVHRSMLKDTDDTPTKSLSANPFPTVVPTPTRRMRRIAQTTIPEVVVECSPDHDAPRYHVIEEATTERTSQTTSLKRHSDSSLPFTGDATSMDMTSRYMRVNQAFEKIRRDLVNGEVVATTGRRQTAELDAVGKVSQNTSAILNRILEYRDKVEICSVGVKDGRVADSQLSASSFHSDPYLPKYGRLDRPGTKFAFWHAAVCGEAGDWLQVYLPLATRVTGVVTQGRSDDIQDYVTGYKVAYGDSADNMIIIQTNGSDLVFEGNHDMHIYKTNMFPQPITARYFRIIVQSWSRCICMRMELLTC